MQDIASLIDHTLLKATASEAEIDRLCREAQEFRFKSVCVNPRWLPFCVQALKDSPSLAISVLSFPLGAQSLKDKLQSCQQLLDEEADEIDMVMDLSFALSGDWAALEKEISSIAKLCGPKALKVILETCYLDGEKIIQCSKICAQQGAAFVKTSTGFGPSGATVKDVSLIKEAVAGTCGVKASGGIRSYDDFLSMTCAGATRVGCSASVSIVKESLKKDTP